MSALGVVAVCGVRRRLAPNVLCMFEQDRPAVQQRPRRGRYPKSVVSLYTFRSQQEQAFKQQAQRAKLNARIAELIEAVRRHRDQAEEHRKEACRPVFLLADMARRTALQDAQMHEGFAEDFSEQLRQLRSSLAASPGLRSEAGLQAVRQEGGAA